MYKRILLKLSGEALKNNCDDIFDVKLINELASLVKEISAKYEVAIVIGGGNIFRGRVSAELGLDRINSDFMGMLATNVNALLLKDVFIKNGLDTVLMSAIEVRDVIPCLDIELANKSLKEGKVVIFGGGTGKPLLSTDTAAALRAKDIGADVILAGKNGVLGIYDSDPNTNKDAKFIKSITYDEIIDNNLQVMDIESIKICKEHSIEVRIFNMNDLNNIKKVLNGEDIGSFVRKEK